MSTRRCPWVAARDHSANCLICGGTGVDARPRLTGAEPDDMFPIVIPDVFVCPDCSATSDLRGHWKSNEGRFQREIEIGDRLLIQCQCSKTWRVVVSRRKRPA